MTALAAVTAGGMLLALGGVIFILALRPAPPRLGPALNQLASQPSRSTTTAAIPPDESSTAWSGSTRWVPSALRQVVEAHVGTSDADLAILAMTRAQLAARMLTGAVIGLLIPPVLTAALAVGGVSLPFALPAVIGIVLAALCWFAPARTARHKAARARAEFTAALRAFLALVAQERAARGSPVEALEEASRPWQAWPFRLIHTEVVRAELAGDTPWDALRQLGTRLGVSELRTLSDIVATAADGAAVFDTLLAEARSLHHAELAAQHARANATSERLVQPLAVMAIGFVLLVLVPPLLRLFQPQ